MPRIRYDPKKDTSSSTPEPIRMFNIGQSVVTIGQGDNWVDLITLVQLEGISTFMEGVDHWFVVDRTANPPEDAELLQPPEDVAVTVEE